MRAPRFFAFFLCLPHVCAKTAIVGASFAFTVDSSACAGAAECTLSKITLKKSVPVPVPVASRVDDVWRGSTGYEERIEHVSRNECKLKDFKMTDVGSYEVDRRIIQVTGLVPVNVSVMEGKTATLPSHLDTTDKDLQLTGWERDGQPVCDVRTGTRPTATGTRCAHQDWINTGDMSLVLRGVQTEQQGLYINYVNDGHGRTDVTAVKLTVCRRPPAPVTPVPTPPPDGNTSVWIAVLAVAAVGGWILSGVFLALWLKSRRSPGPGATGEHPDGSNQLGLLTNGDPARPRGQHDSGV